jgi:tRNA A37 threonylcarbamoyladenosine synthetase subunit TsaC/SUA5/YrdC
VSEHRVVTSLRDGTVVQALADCEVIVIPDADGYALAVRRECPAAWPAFWALTARHCGGQVDTVAVGESAQAAALCEKWDGPIMQLTDRVWPGPLTVITASSEGSPVRITMPKDRALRGLCRSSGPLVLCGLRNVRGQPVTDVAEVRGQIGADAISLVVDGGTWHGGLAPTVVDCTHTPPVITEVGALPSSYIEAALLMAARRKRGWGSRAFGV